MESFVDLPEDVFEEIMSHLSPEALIRSMLVEKSWYNRIKALIANPTFVKKHVHNQKVKQLCLVFKGHKFNDTGPFGRGRETIGKQAFVTIFDEEDNHDSLSYNVDSFKPLLKHFQISLGGSHCDGIICLTNYIMGDIALWNPTTRDVKLLLDIPEDAHIVRAGFGYDPIAGVYKVVRVLGLTNYKDFGAQVYALGDKSWRDIKMPLDLKCCQMPNKKDVYCKGVYYWLVQFDITLQETIHAFDMHDEEFHTIPLPDQFRSKAADKLFDLSFMGTNLFEWNESVALLYCDWESSTKPIEIWAMHAHEPSNKGRHKMSSECWTKYLSVCQPEGIPKIPLAFLNSEELLMREGKKALVSYNLYTKNVRRLYEGDMKRSRAFTFVKSLVSVSGLTKSVRRS